MPNAGAESVISQTRHLRHTYPKVTALKALDPPDFDSVWDAAGGGCRLASADADPAARGRGERALRVLIANRGCSRQRAHVFHEHDPALSSPISWVIKVCCMACNAPSVGASPSTKLGTPSPPLRYTSPARSGCAASSKRIAIGSDETNAHRNMRDHMVNQVRHGLRHPARAA